MRYAATLSVGACLLAGCNAAPSQAPAADNAQVAKAKADATKKQAEQRKAWAALFAAPETAVNGAAQFGYRNKPYAKTADGAISTGNTSDLGTSYGPKPNLSRFEAAGADAATIDTLRFSLEVQDASAAKLSRERLAKVVLQYLFQFGIDTPGDLTTAIDAGRPATIALPGATAQVAPAGARDSALTVTFTRSGASAPTHS